MRPAVLFHGNVKSHIYKSARQTTFRNFNGRCNKESETTFKIN